MLSAADVDLTQTLALVASAHRLAALNRRALPIWLAMLTDHERFLLVRWAARHHSATMVVVA